MRNYLIAIIFICLTLPTTAQTYEAGVWAGAANYFGDLNTNFSFQRIGPAGGVFGRINLNPRITLKGGANYANIGFDDALIDNPFQKARNLSFKSDIIEGLGQVEFNFLPFIPAGKKYFSPYVFIGGGVFYFNPKTYFEDEWVALQPLGTEGQQRNDEYSLFQGMIVYGGGFKYALNYAWSVNLEASSRRIFTDYLDDVSGLYADRDNIESLRGETAALLSDRSWEVEGIETLIGEAGRQRGDNLNNDMFVTLGISLVYHFHSIKCPTYE